MSKMKDLDTIYVSREPDYGAWRLMVETDRRKYAEALLWRYKLGFWLMALALVIDLAAWMWR